MDPLDFTLYRIIVLELLPKPLEEKLFVLHLVDSNITQAKSDSLDEATNVRKFERMKGDVQEVDLVENITSTPVQTEPQGYEGNEDSTSWCDSLTMAPFDVSAELDPKHPMSQIRWFGHQLADVAIEHVEALRVAVEARHHDSGVSDDVER